MNNKQAVDKKNVKKNIPNTINEKHNEIMKKFEKNETEKIPILIKEIQNLKLILISLIDITNQDENIINYNDKLSFIKCVVNYNDKKTTESKPQKMTVILTSQPPPNVINIDKYIDIYEQIMLKRREIKEIKMKKKKYCLENAKCIFHYFEQKKNISTGGGDQNTNILNNFFKIKTINNDEENIENNDKYRTSKYIYQNYWKNVNGEILNIADYAIAMDTCHYCNSGEFIHQEEEGILICNNTKCGKFVTHIVDGSKPFNKEPPNEISYTAYIRLNHFKEILSQFQAKETTQISPEIIDLIRARIKKERITDLSKLNYEIMRDILRKLGLNKYFEHIQYINSIFGVKPPVMSETLIETLCVLFIEIQPKFSIYCPANRTNLLSYSYILHQLCVLLDQKQYLPYITTLKDIEKQRQNDATWYLICKSLDWQYFPTI